MKIFVKNLKGNHFQLQVKPQDTAPATPKSPSIEASTTPPTTVPKEALPASMPTSVPTQIISSSVSESDVGGQAAVSLDAGNV